MKIDTLQVGDKLYKYATFCGVQTYEVMAIYVIENLVFYKLECLTCCRYFSIFSGEKKHATGSSCMLLVSKEVGEQQDYLCFFKMLNNPDQESFHSRNHYYYTSYRDALENAYSQQLKESGEQIREASRSLKQQKQSFKTFVAAYIRHKKNEWKQP